MPGEAKNWTFTIYPNLDDDGSTYEHQLREKYPTLFNGTLFNYICFQLESCPESSRAHIQGYVQLRVKKTLNMAKRLLGENTAHLEIARGTPQQNREYCKKENSRIAGPWEFGEIMTTGQKRKLQEVCDDIEAGKITRICQVPAIFRVKHKDNNFMDILNRTPPPPAIRDVRVVCLAGTTRIGKSWLIHKLFPSEEICKVIYGNCGVWAPNYVRQDILLLDEFNSQIKLQSLLQLLDIYPYTLEDKGVTRLAHYTKVVICTNKDPHLFYQPEPGKEDTREEERKALWARIGLEVRPGAPVRGLTLNYLNSPWIHSESGITALRADMEEKVKSFFEIN